MQIQYTYLHYSLDFMGRTLCLISVHAQVHMYCFHSIAHDIKQHVPTAAAEYYKHGMGMLNHNR